MRHILKCTNCNPAVTHGNKGWQLEWSVGNLFPRDDQGNTQRLWPSGQFDPGVQSWDEEHCRRRWWWKHCHTETHSAAVPPVGWSPMQLVHLKMCLIMLTRG